MFTRRNHPGKSPCRNSGEILSDFHRAKSPCEIAHRNSGGFFSDFTGRNRSAKMARHEIGWNLDNGESPCSKSVCKITLHTSQCLGILLRKHHQCKSYAKLPWFLVDLCSAFTPLPPHPLTLDIGMMPAPHLMHSFILNLGRGGTVSCVELPLPTAHL